MAVFEERLQDYHQRVDSALLKFIGSKSLSSSPLNQPMRYGALLGGKRLRPYLVYATGHMLGVPLEILDVPAAAVECIHAYSLIHDDLPAMDNDQLRRGQPTCHLKFGEAIAILTGDALQALAFSILTDAPMPKVSAEIRVSMISGLAKASGVFGMCTGQALDLAVEGQQIDLSALEQIHQHKTGALIRCAVQLGALPAAIPCVLKQLDEYAQAIGLAFQVQDDILDVIGDSKITGKRSGADQQRDKNTYPMLLGLSQAQAKALELYQQALAALQQLEQQYNLNTQALKSLANFIIERDN